MKRKTKMNSDKKTPGKIKRTKMDTNSMKRKPIYNNCTTMDNVEQFGDHVW